MFICWYDDPPSWGTQYTRSSSLLSKEEKDSWDDQDEGGGCSAAEGGSMKLQLKVFSGSWWATENEKQTQQRRGQPEVIVPSYKNNKSAVIHSSTCYRGWQDEGSVEKWVLYLYYMQQGLHRSGSFCVCWQGFTYMDHERYPESCCLNDAAMIFVKFYCHVTT